VRPLSSDLFSRNSVAFGAFRPVAAEHLELERGLEGEVEVVDRSKKRKACLRTALVISVSLW
jgi:hypothetical protein